MKKNQKIQLENLSIKGKTIQVLRTQNTLKLKGGDETEAEVMHWNANACI